MPVSILERLNVRERGVGEPPVVFAHGFGSDQTAWQHQVAAIEPRHRVVLLDYLGCGQSHADDFDPIRYASIDRYVEDVAAVLDTLDCKRIVFVGHSVSAMIGVRLERLRSDLVSRLVLLSASPRYTDDVGYSGGFSTEDVIALHRTMAADYLSWANGFGRLMMGNFDRPELGVAFGRQLAAMRPDIAQSVARMMFRLDMRDQLSSIQVPTLVLQTARDPAVPRTVGAYLTAHIPNARLVVLDTDGHLPHISAADQVTAALRGFVDG